jgi:5-hydroxyisourate hydrolase
MGYLTTHVLDTARGRPAEGMRIELHRLEGGARTALAETRTNADGRTDAPILPQDAFAPGTYELTFHVGAYHGGSAGRGAGGEAGEGGGFLDAVPIRFAMSEDAHYHVPLLLSPFGYSTYRGS